MSDVTFTPEQIREILDLINVAHTSATCYESRATPEYFRGVDRMRTEALSMFKLPEVTRYRTFTMTWGDRPDSNLETYRINGGQVEYLSDIGKWYTTNYGTGLVASFAEQLVAKERWTALAAFADVCARPTEEVDG